MNAKLIALTVRLMHAAKTREDRGQGTLEYVGAVVIAAVIVVAVAGAFGGIDIKGAVKTATDHILQAK
jgi:hypothetical protein